ncbi:MAG: hypothetical protein V1867_03065 [Candidatus Falkowbacteria bacterium]
MLDIEANGRIFTYYEEERTVVRYKDREKSFRKKPIFFGINAYKEATEKSLKTRGGIVLAMNGYNSLSSEFCASYGFSPEEYEKICASILAEAIGVLFKKFPGIDVRLAHGASNKAVNKAAISIGRKLKITQLGFSCPVYMLDAEDDDIPVYVALNKEACRDAIISASDIILTVNGGKTAFEMDVDAVFKRHKYLILVNAMPAISYRGDLSATDEQGNIIDAVALWRQKMDHISSITGFSDLDHWDSVKESVVTAAERIIGDLRLKLRK